MSKKSRKPKVKKTAFGEMMKTIKEYRRNLNGSEFYKDDSQLTDKVIERLVSSRSIGVDAAQAIAAREAFKEYRGDDDVEGRMPFRDTFFHFNDYAMEFANDNGNAALMVECILVCNYNEPGAVFEKENFDTDKVLVIALTHLRNGKAALSWTWGRPANELTSKSVAGLDASFYREMEELLLGTVAMLSSANVELEELPSFPRGHVAHHAPQFEVVIRQGGKRRQSKPSLEPQEMHYTHRFERRGGFIHHWELTPAGTPNRIFAAWARDKPDKIMEIDGKPCVRIWRRDCIVGPSDKPLIPKLRRVA